MPNYSPRFTISGDVTSDGISAMSPILTTAAADYTGVSANNKVAFTAGAGGSRIAGLRFKAIGTNVASVARIFVNNGGVNTTATNNAFIGEVGLPATTASASNGTPDVDFYFPGGYIDLNALFKILVGLGTTVASGWVVSPIQGGKF